MAIPHRRRVPTAPGHGLTVPTVFLAAGSAYGQPDFRYGMDNSHPDSSGSFGVTFPVVAMPTPFPQDEPLRGLMAQAHIPSYRALAQRSGISRSSINHLRRGTLGTLRLATLQRLSQTLGVDLADLIAQCGGAVAPLERQDSPPAMADRDSGNHLDTLRREYGQLQQRFIDQEQALRQQMQRQALGVMEPWLLMWPNAAQAAQDKPDLPASKVIPLTRPLQALLQTWAVRPIGVVGEVVPYDPQLHQPMAGTLAPGQAVQVRHLGYWHGEDLLYRAKVIPVEEGVS